MRTLNAAIAVVLFLAFLWRGGVIKPARGCTYALRVEICWATATVPYLRARLLAVPAVGINFAFRDFGTPLSNHKCT